MKTKTLSVLFLFLSLTFVWAQEKESPVVLKEHFVRKHIIQQNLDYPSPWFDAIPRIYDVSDSSDDPKIYLGQPIRYEWQGEEYPPELYAKVDELTRGITSEYDKLVILANWVKHSKDAVNASYVLWPPSIADVWRSPSGDCDEAAFELGAMCRVAGIPAMNIDTWNRWHTAVRAYVDGRWVIADATPISLQDVSDSSSVSNTIDIYRWNNSRDLDYLGDIPVFRLDKNRGIHTVQFQTGIENARVMSNDGKPANIYEPNNPRFIAAFQERPLGTLRGVPIPGTDGQKVDYFTYFSYETVSGERNKYKAIGLDLAKLAFPVTNEFLYYNSDTHLFTEDKSKQKVFIFYRIDGQDDLCLNNRGSWYTNSMRFISPGIFWRTVGYNRESSYVGMFYSRGYIVTSLPTCGNFRVIYSFSNMDLNSPGDLQALAYVEVQLLSNNGVTVVTPKDLRPMPGADNYYFEALVGVLSKLPTYEKLGGKR